MISGGSLPRRPIRVRRKPPPPPPSLDRPPPVAFRQPQVDFSLEATLSMLIFVPILEPANEKWIEKPLVTYAYNIGGSKNLLGYLYAFALSTCCYILWLERSIICAVFYITLWRWYIWWWCFIRAWGSIWAATAEGCKMCLKSRELSGQVVWLKPDPEIVTIVSSTPSWVTPGLVTYPILLL